MWALCYDLRNYILLICTESLVTVSASEYTQNLETDEEGRGMLRLLSDCLYREVKMK
jgi:hypothetical protein